jgi:hypothetical protein
MKYGLHSTITSEFITFCHILNSILVVVIISPIIRSFLFIVIGGEHSKNKLIKVSFFLKAATHEKQSLLFEYHFYEVNAPESLLQN